MVLKKEVAFFAVIVVFALFISIIAYSLSSSDPLLLFARLLALNGFIAVSIAAIITPFIKELTLFLKKPFTTIHHYFAAAGLLLLTLHPIAIAIQTMYPAILLPNVQSLYLFFVYGGSVALIAIYVAFGAVLIRRKIVVYWRYFHMLMYLALFFGVVHANLLGQDLMQNLGLALVYDALFAASLFAFALKRWQFHQIRVRMKENARNKQQASAPAQT